MSKKTWKISELAGFVNGEWHGEQDVLITGLVDLDNASEGQIAFVSDRKRLEELQKIEASALIVPEGCLDAPVPFIEVKDPVLAAAIIHNHFLEDDYVAGGIEPSVVIGEECLIAEDVTVGAFVAIGNRVNIGHRVTVGAGSVIGDDVVLGNDTVIHPNVTVLNRSVLGARVIVHSGTVIGSDGFGYAHDETGRHVKRPHVGFVQIDDDVELGANVCVDRATFGRTWIKRGTKIDNLVQVAHNVVIGEDSILVSQSGISGSTVLGNGVIMGGKSAISGHLVIGNRVTIAAKAGVASNQDDGKVIAGFPAIPHKKWLRAATALQKLPDLIKEVRELRKMIVTENVDENPDQD